jgi:hypothetical protein
MEAISLTGVEEGKAETILRTVRYLYILTFIYQL